jgi:ATP-dependent NAD(P)H-hydrate dehydratase
MLLASKSSAIIRSYLSGVVAHNFVSSLSSVDLIHPTNHGCIASIPPVHRFTSLRAMQSQSTSDSDDAATSKTTYHRWEDHKDTAISQCILPLSNASHKGSSGRIAVVGGSELYTGAPYFAGLAALRTGASLLSLLTAQEAALPLKCYSPDFMVESVYTTEKMHEVCPSSYSKHFDSDDDLPDPMLDMLDSITAHVREKRIHCCVIGPGLGRHPNVLRTAAHLIVELRDMGMFLVLDADALFLLSKPQYRNILKGYDKAVLTPNVVEYQRLMDGKSEDDKPFESVTIVQKGSIDAIWHGGQVRYQCDEPGGLKRCGGVGDVLAGTIGTLVAWQVILAAASKKNKDSAGFQVDQPLACWTACCIVKRATQRAFDVKKRAMSAQDILNHLGPTMGDMIGEWVLWRQPFSLKMMKDELRRLYINERAGKW